MGAGCWRVWLRCSVVPGPVVALELVVVLEPVAGSWRASLQCLAAPGAVAAVRAVWVDWGDCWEVSWAMRNRQSAVKTISPLADLGRLPGRSLGGGGKSMGGALGGGVMALLAAMAYKALQGSGAEPQTVPIGLAEPKTDADRQELEQHAELIVKAMINAAKADGKIDTGEVKRIVGKLQEDGIQESDQQFLIMEMQKPMETPQLIAAAQGRPDVAAQVYAASLLAIEVDTPCRDRNILTNWPPVWGSHRR